jgi:hypothetical protein
MYVSWKAMSAAAKRRHTTYFSIARALEKLTEICCGNRKNEFIS